MSRKKMPDAEKESALSPYRVLDLADAKGVYGTRMLADLGADVIKIEPPEGDPGRNIPPFVGGVPGIERSLSWLYRNLNKRSITLNIESQEGREIFRRLVQTADVVVETFRPGYMKKLGLDYERLKKINHGLIMASVTDFGQTGPYSQYKGSDIVDFAMSGAMHCCGLSEDPPVNAPGPLARDCGAIYAACGIMLALYTRAFTDRGQYIDISVQEAAHSGVFPWDIPGYDQGMAGCMEFGVRIRSRKGGYLVIPCEDGYVNYVVVSPKQIQALYDTLGNPPDLEQFGTDFVMYNVRSAEVIDTITRYSMQMPVEEFFQRGQEQFGLPACPIYRPDEYLENRHVKKRGFFEEVDHPEAGKGMYANMPFKLMETPNRIRRPAPRLGENNMEIYRQELGFTTEELSALRMSGII